MTTTGRVVSFLSSWSAKANAQQLEEALYDLRNHVDLIPADDEPRVVKITLEVADA